MGEAGKAGGEQGCDGTQWVPSSTSDTSLEGEVDKGDEHTGEADTRQGDSTGEAGEAAMEQVIPRGSSNIDS